LQGVGEREGDVVLPVLGDGGEAFFCAGSA
jgi:hypothetical protein